MLSGLSERLRASRAAANLTQGQVSDALGYRPGTIAAWERERAEPCASDLARLALLYRVSVDWLLTGRPHLPHRFERAIEPLRLCPHGTPIDQERCSHTECDRGA